MINRIKAFFAASDDPGDADDGGDELQLAAAALLVEAAQLDEEFDDDERAKVAELVQRRFGLDRPEADSLVEMAEAAVADSTQLIGFTRVIKDRFDHDQRVELLEMLWEVVYSDQQLHDHEASLMRRVAGLLFVSDRENGSARKRARQRLGLEA